MVYQIDMIVYLICIFLLYVLDFKLFTLYHVIIIEIIWQYMEIIQSDGIVILEYWS
jgi:hypothetical protein